MSIPESESSQKENANRGIRDGLATGADAPVRIVLDSDLAQTVAFNQARESIPSVNIEECHVGDGTIGERYRLELELGRGGFGSVHKAWDEQLRRAVAIKIILPRLLSLDSQDRYLDEARTVAALDHPHIAAVYDVGRTADGDYFIVSKLIDGSDLSKRMKSGTLERSRAISIVASIADALHYSHSKGLVHRDVKPANILIDQQDRAYLADFGIALREEDYGKGDQCVGTPAYMSPEQARGEGHRVDNRSDIYSLGVVLYELLTGRLTFRCDNVYERLQLIASEDVRSPRIYDDTIPPQLDRICLRAVARRASERYQVAGDLAEDLRNFQRTNQPHSQNFTPPNFVSNSETPQLTPIETQKLDSTKNRAVVLPKGLRSYDAADSAFFLELLPGPFDRDGLPESIKFWKSKLECKDETAFRVGLIYGPSGCGKSSLVKAGLIPRLADNILVVYCEASAGETEERLIRGLKRRAPDAEGETLRDLLASIRRRRLVPSAGKLLIIIDQFEQWLHAESDYARSSLTEGLHQCDGSQVQALVMVRDDFWLSVSRFLKELEIPILEKENSALVDLFDAEHASHVLSMLGSAYGKLPANQANWTRDQYEFLRQAINGLTEARKVIGVQLAIFADMMRSRPWTTTSLRVVGGIAGIGVTFLEETFSAKQAPPENRLHAAAARAVLAELLPDLTTDMKGHKRSHEELQSACGYANRPDDFQVLLKILDGQLRLITPADIEASGSSTKDNAPHFYQLTHDYLVSAIREWLSQNQRETHRGRAELVLIERTSRWQSKHENKQLTTVGEWLRIHWLTKSNNWKPAEQEMMRKSDRYHAARLAILALCACLVLVACGLFRSSLMARQSEAEAVRMVDGLLSSETSEINNLLSKMKPFQRWASPLLASSFVEAPQNSKAKLHAALGQVVNQSEAQGQYFEYVKDHFPSLSPTQLAPVRSLLEPFGQTLKTEYWSWVEDENCPADKRFHALCALAAWDPTHNNWSNNRLLAIVAEQLVAVSPSFIEKYQDIFRPVQDSLVPSLKQIFQDPARSEMQRNFAATILADYAADSPQTLCDLIVMADPFADKLFFPLIVANREKAIVNFETLLNQELKPQWPDVQVAETPSVSPELKGLFLSSNGTITDRFAFCTSMNWAEFLESVEQLRAQNYRPTRVRPWLKAGQAKVAAVWTRDGRRWKVSVVNQRKDLPDNGAVASHEELTLADISTLPTLDSARSRRWLALWVEPTTEDDQGLLGIDLADSELARFASDCANKGYKSQQILTVSTDHQRQRRYCGIWSKTGAVSEIQAQYAGFEIIYKPQWDISVAEAGVLPDPRKAYAAQLRFIDSLPEDKSNHPDFQKMRAIAQFVTGDLDNALEGFVQLQKANKSDPELLLYKTLSLGKLKKVEEAEKSLAEYGKLNTDPAFREYLKIQLLAFKSDWHAAWQAIEHAEKVFRSDSNSLYNIACTSSLCAVAAEKEDAAASKRFRMHCFKLLNRLITEMNFKNAEQLKTDVDFSALHSDAQFTALFEKLEPPLKFATLLQANIDFTARLINYDGSQQSRSQAESLFKAGYRPHAIVADSQGAKLLLHIPLNPDDQRERLAMQQAAAAVSLLRLGRIEKVLPLLDDRPDPRVRSYLLHRLTDIGLESDASDQLFNLVTTEERSDRLRAIVQAIGELARRKTLSSIQHTKLDKDLARIYAEHPDPGVHSMCEWTLKQLGSRQPIDKLASELADGKINSNRRWYLTKTGRQKLGSEPLTMMIANANEEFLMGSPISDLERPGGPTAIWEALHRQRVDRRFAIASKEVTISQFREYFPGFRYHTDFIRDENAPAVVDWYSAAQYCNWLSKQDGIPREQWCYNPDGHFREGMMIPADCLEKIGYRLPTEAEWEFACRAGTTTSRFYGESERLLVNYAWYSKNTDDRRIETAGILRPNPLGLFDMLGNVLEFANDQSEYYRYEQEYCKDVGTAAIVQDNQNRAMRGGGFFNKADCIRSARRDIYATGGNGNNYGFRPVRTLPSADQ